MKNISTLIIILSIALISNAQEFKGGIIVGLSTSQLSGDHLEGFNKAGLIFGGFTSRSFSEKISGKMELLYIQKGSKNPEANDYNSTILHEYYLDYIEVPVILQYQIQEQTLIETGLQIGVLIKSKEQDVNGNEMKHWKDFNKTDFSICLGLNYSLNSNWSLNSRYSNTILFSPVRGHQASDSQGYKKWYNKGQYNSVLSFALQYTFK
ncbi:MAG: porin family protein [Bacteroidota bacterium]|nr:porin family protein [Bacteroidota bacterium]